MELNMCNNIQAYYKSSLMMPISFFSRICLAAFQIGAFHPMASLGEKRVTYTEVTCLYRLFYMNLFPGIYFISLFQLLFITNDRSRL